MKITCGYQRIRQEVIVCRLADAKLSKKYSLNRVELNNKNYVDNENKIVYMLILKSHRKSLLSLKIV